MKFKETVTSEEALREIVDYPREVVLRKEIHRLDEHCKQFISQSPFLMIATSDADGLCDVSPRGDTPGFVKVLDDWHLVIPERPGNRRVDSMRNILSNPHVGLIFVIPGLKETLRVNGQACITKDPELLQHMVVKGNVPALAIGVRVEQCFLHCAKAFIRSGLWEPETWPSEDERPVPAEILAAHANMPDMTEKEAESLLHESYTQRLY
ncbi:pyridoxamine 5'-phosphate oxidase family protein [Xylanibacillus composti]|uniref:Phosphohydrolase n=1 Tax=Xylanibacillus composti TaxID=1572762 RepID=A0A8J4H9C6_9BACL|nr:pyridoxamine 5'-phosphate oxidase family protein [Xylanibacillus composti]MDT9725903.1 pyridoxamine 5'-phosphate oxidase family protein [Xylanibacillus composti]GIQ71268.1 phosphohydrolase [Xylanibacillus composti]